MIDRTITVAGRAVGIEIVDFDPFPGTIDCRVFIGSALGVLPEKFTARFTIDDASSSDEDQLGSILKYCGVPIDTNANGYVDDVEARAWLLRTPKDEAVKTIEKWLREIFFIKLAEVINKLLNLAGAGVSTTTGEPYADFEALLKDVVARRMIPLNMTDGRVAFTL